MKLPADSPLLFLLYFTMFARTASGQGAISFSNLDPFHGINAPFYDADGTTRLSGENFRAALYTGPVGTSEANFVMVGSPQPFRTGNFAGYWTPATIVSPVPNPGGTLLAQVRFWDTQGGTLVTFEQALAAGAKVGFSLVLALQVPFSGSAVLTGLRSASLITVLPPLALGDTRSFSDSMSVPNGRPAAELCSRPVGLLRWFQLSFAGGGEAVIHTEGSSIDTVFSVFTRCSLAANDCTLISCNDNRAPGQTASEARFQAQTNVTYLLAVGGVNGATGNVQISISLPVNLAVQRVLPGSMELSWPVEASNFALESAEYASSSVWQEVQTKPAIIDGRMTVRVDTVGRGRVYRLKRVLAP